MTNDRGVIKLKFIALCVIWYVNGGCVDGIAHCFIFHHQCNSNYEHFQQAQMIKADNNNHGLNHKINMRRHMDEKYFLILIMTLFGRRRGMGQGHSGLAICLSLAINLSF